MKEYVSFSPRPDEVIAQDETCNDAACWKKLPIELPLGVIAQDATCNDAACGKNLPIELPLGAALGRGTSGVVFPLLSSTDGARYVVKEVIMEAVHEKLLMQEVYLHRICSDGCAGVVRYAYSTITTSPTFVRRLHVLMEACDRELWDVLIANRTLAPSLSNTADLPSPTAAYGELPGVPCACESSIPVAESLSNVERKLWTLTLCEALRHCHARRVLHRDLNPWNVLVATDQDSTTGQACRGVRLADFGLAVQLPDGVDELVGTESDGAIPLDSSALESLYSAPELGENYGFAADIYSLGMTLFALWWAPELAGPGASICTDIEAELTSAVETVKMSAFAGTPPCDASFLPQLRKGANTFLRSLILQMLCASPSDRPSAEEAYSLCRKWYDSREPLEWTGPETEALDREDSSQHDKVSLAQSVEQPTKQSCCSRVWLRMWSCRRNLRHKLSASDEVKNLSTQSADELI